MKLDLAQVTLHDAPLERIERAGDVLRCRIDYGNYEQAEPFRLPSDADQVPAQLTFAGVAEVEVESEDEVLDPAWWEEHAGEILRAKLLPGGGVELMFQTTPREAPTADADFHVVRFTCAQVDLEAEAAELSPERRHELERRLAEYQADPSQAIPANEVFEEIRARQAGRSGRSPDSRP